MYKVDFHTHQTVHGDYIQITNVFAQDLPSPDSQIFFSTGIHPWHIDLVKVENCLENISIAARQKNMLAVGECGIDRSVNQELSTQISIFLEQVKIAEQFRKPLVIHCVHAFSDLLKLKKDCKSLVPWIIHGYLGNAETSIELIKHGFYFSVGNALIKNQRMKEILPLLPLNRLFFETDNSHFSLDQIYKFASHILEIEEEKLTELIYNNFNTLFGDEWMVAKN
jgi:TatD DNase family protein